MEREKLTQTINDAVESLREELVALACDIFAIPTQNPPGNNYLECTAAIARWMERIGMEVEFVDVPEDRLAELAPHFTEKFREKFLYIMEGSRGR